MIYNLVEYLKTQLPTINFTSNGFKSGSPKNVVAVSDNGGFPNPQHDRKDYSIQIMSRGADNPIAKKQADDVYNLINKKFGLILPEATIKVNEIDVVYPELKTWKIVAEQLPGYIGNDKNGLPLFSNNYTITTN